MVGTIAISAVVGLVVGFICTLIPVVAAWAVPIGAVAALLVFLQRTGA